MHAAAMLHDCTKSGTSTTLGSPVTTDHTLQHLPPLLQLFDRSDGFPSVRKGYATMLRTGGGFLENSRTLPKQTLVPKFAQRHVDALTSLGLTARAGPVARQHKSCRSRLNQCVGIRADRARHAVDPRFVRAAPRVPEARSRCSCGLRVVQKWRHMCKIRLHGGESRRGSSQWLEEASALRSMLKKKTL